MRHCVIWRGPLQNSTNILDKNAPRQNAGHGNTFSGVSLNLYCQSHTTHLLGLEDGSHNALLRDQIAFVEATKADEKGRHVTTHMLDQSA